MNCVDELKKLAEKGHQGQFRKDGKTPYVEHPRAVVELLTKWGVTDEVTLAVAWGHDLLEDTSVREEEIRQAGGTDKGARILDAIRMLSWDKAAFPDKKEWLRHIARKGGSVELLVKSADRICNTRGFLELGDVKKARGYLAEAAPIFAMVPVPMTETVTRELEAVRKELDAARKSAEGGITELYFILDRSGSMSQMAKATIDGFNSTLTKHRQEATGELYVSTVLFDDQVEVLHNHVPVEQVAPLTEREYYARGCTALLDAVGRGINHAVRFQRHAPEARRAKNVVFVIMTDGYENASREYTLQQVKEMVEKETREYDWEFLFLGANIDAIAVAGALGIRASRSSNYVADSAGMESSWGSVEEAVRMARTMSCEERKLSYERGEWKRRVDEDYRRRGKPHK